ncbi:uncharacterized protein wu:fa19b12 [Dunckerocampus dactyliophorus]|uniref:uncharacterized protein wu:fa19b12 n=1 Tax=Dunckerocampus dactyliophorus TaxID=161453 RepID=UPI002406681D|nr:uncharacterized protein wu:fa19b12 [Dunckerocampus dactyliophorus]
MAKRHAEDTLFSKLPAKRSFKSLCRVDLQFESIAPHRDVSPTCTPASSDGHCRKRLCCLENPDVQEERIMYPNKTLQLDSLNKNASHAQTFESFSITSSCSRKRRREEPVDLETAIAKDSDKADTDPEDCTYNSFQFWRAPLPELDLSLLDESSGQSQTKHSSNVKNSCDAMET